MGTEITLDNNCKIFYATFPVRLRRYNFEYITFHEIKHEHYYEIHFVNIEHKNKFEVRSFSEDDVYFDTFDEAEAYIFKQFIDLKYRIQKEESEIQAFIERKKGSKKST